MTFRNSSVFAWSADEIIAFLIQSTECVCVPLAIAVSASECRQASLQPGVGSLYCVNLSFLLLSSSIPLRSGQPELGWAVQILHTTEEGKCMEKIKFMWLFSIWQDWGGFFIAKLRWWFQGQYEIKASQDFIFKFIWMYSPIYYCTITLEITALCCSHAFDDIHVSSLSLTYIPLYLYCR